MKWAFWCHINYGNKPGISIALMKYPTSHVLMLLTVHVKVSDFPSSIYWYNPSHALSPSFSLSLRRKRVGRENNTRACECVSKWAFILRCLLYNIIFQFASVFLCVKIVREKQFVTKEVVYLILRVSQYISYPKLVNV